MDVPQPWCHRPGQACHGRRSHDPGRPVQPAPRDRVRPPELLPEWQHERGRIASKQCVQQRRAGPWQADHDQRSRHQRVEDIWAVAEFVVQPCLGDVSAD
jgi:hypothetical protein